MDWRTFFPSMLSNWMGVPIGTNIRQPVTDKGQRQSREDLVEGIVLVSSILNITTDDVCIGNDPLFLDVVGDESNEFSEEGVKRLEIFVKEANTVAKWIARDLLLNGMSMYKIRWAQDKVIILPVLEDMRFFLGPNKQVHVYYPEINLLQPLESTDLLFLHYMKKDLSKVEDSDIEGMLFEIKPRGIQVSNIDEVLRDLVLTERAVLKYRLATARILRMATVEVGQSQGDKLDAVINTVAAGLNADPGFMTQGMDTSFEDEIPVFPMRKGLGAVDIKEFVPSADIKELSDLDYILSKVFLAMRFPKSYADFNQTVTETAISTIRGDIRYSRMVETCRSMIETVLNAKVDELTSTTNELKTKIRLTQLPTPEEDEVLVSIGSYLEKTVALYEFIMGDTDTKETALSKMNQFLELMGNSSRLKSIQKWAEVLKEYIELKFTEDEVQATNDRETVPEGEGTGDEAFGE